MATMAEDICEFELKDISAAFEQWRKEETVVPTAADIRKICISLLSERAKPKSTWKPNITFTQVVRERTANWDGEVLEENPHGKHKSPLALEKLYHPKHVCQSFRRDQEV